MLRENDEWFAVSLRFCGDRLPLEHIVSWLGIKPSYMAAKGDHIRKNPRYALHESNVWVWDFTQNSKELFETQLNRLLESLEPVKSALDEILSLEGVFGELFLGFSSGCGQGGTFFSPQLLSRIANLRLGIQIDLYPPSIDENESSEPSLPAGR